MKISISSNLNSVINSFSKRTERFVNNNKVQLSNLGKDLQTQARNSMLENKSGSLYIIRGYPHIASAKGEPLASITGTALKSITYHTSNNTLYFGSNNIAFYVWEQKTGAERPTLKSAVDKYIPIYTQVIGIR